MNALQIREAKAGFSAIVTAAEKGRPTLITRHGQAVAMLVPAAEGRRLFPGVTPSLADYLLQTPERLKTQRSKSGLRSVKL